LASGMGMPRTNLFQVPAERVETFAHGQAYITG
jgi:hypothetical protein